MTSSSEQLAQAAEFLDILHRGGNYHFYQAFNNNKRRSFWAPVEERLTIPQSYLNGWDAYWGVNPTTQIVTDADRAKYPGKPDEYISQYIASKNATIAAVNTLYAEYDGKDETNPAQEHIDRLFGALRNDPKNTDKSDKTILREATTAAQKEVFAGDMPYYLGMAWDRIQALPVAASVIVFSGGGYQPYWLLEETFLTADNPAAVEYIKDIQARWVPFMGADIGAKDLRRILRVPGTINHKKAYQPNNPLVTFVHYDPDRRYRLDDLAALLPKPEPKPEPAPRPVTVRATGETVVKTYTGTGTREHSDHVYRVMAAYNDRHDIVSTLLSYGYTQATPDRLSRPGEPDSKGVAILDGKSYHHSGNDPLFEACGEHRLSPFDVVVHLDYNGDYERAAVEIGKQLGIYDPAFIDFVLAHELHRAEHADFSKIIPEEKHSANGYLTGATDKAVYMNVLALMGERKRIADVMIGHRRIATATNSDGVTVALCGTGTVKNCLDRLNGVLIDSHTVQLDTGAPVTVLSLAAPVVSRLDTLYKQLLLECEGVSNLLTTVKESVFTTGNVQEYLADDAFLTGRSALVNGQIANNMEALCFAYPHYAEARRAYQAAKEHKPADVHELRAAMGGELLATYQELKQRSEEEFLKSFGTYGLIVLDDVDANPATTRKEIAERRGLKASSVGTALRKLEAWGLVESEQGFGAAKVYTAVADVWGAVKERTPEAMSYTLGAQRADRQLEQAQQHAKAAVATAENEDAERAARKRLARIENKRFKTVPVIYPNFDPSMVADWIYGTSSHADYMGRESQQQEAPAQTAGEPTLQAFVELDDLESRRQAGDATQFTAEDYSRQKYLDRQVGGGFFSTETELEQVAAEIRMTGKTGSAAAAEAFYRGYDEQEAQRIGEQSLYPTTGNQKLVYHYGGTIEAVTP